MTAARITVLLIDDTVVQHKNRAAQGGLYLAQHGAASNLSSDFGLGRHPGRHRVELLATPCLADLARPRPDAPGVLETRPEPCVRCNDLGHFATVRLTANPDRGVQGAYTGVHEVCQCCAFPAGKAGLYEVMRGQASGRQVGIELRQPAGEWS